MIHKNSKIAILGLGYVGLPVLIAFSKIDILCEPLRLAANPTVLIPAPIIPIFISNPWHKCHINVTLAYYLNITVTKELNMNNSSSFNSYIKSLAEKINTLMKSGDLTTLSNQIFR